MKDEDYKVKGLIQTEKDVNVLFKKVDDLYVKFEELKKAVDELKEHNKIFGHNHITFGIGKER